MMPGSEPSSTKFLLLTERLIILPTPFAISDTSYLSLYAALHASEQFCTTGFGDSRPARSWTHQEVYEEVLKDVTINWRGPARMGDCALGLRPVLDDDSNLTVATSADHEGYTILEGESYEQFMSSVKATGTPIQWCGYVGARNGLHRLLPPEDGKFPEWPEMIELRYGISPSFWGRGIAPEAAKAILDWAISQRDTKRFIAATKRTNTRSEGVLRRLGFVENDTTYWQDPTVREWERRSMP